MKGRLTLIVGDTIALLFFAWLGRASHGKAGLLGIVETALPFWLGWMGAGWVLGAYRPEAHESTRAALGTTVRVWAVGIPLGLVIRAVWLRRGIPLSFAVVTMLTTLVILGLWRGGWAYLQERRAPHSA